MRGVFLLGLVAAGCARDPIDAVCPAVAEGDIVMSEVRGPQTPADLDGPWIEVFNASGATVDLEGLRIRFRDRGGTGEIPVLVRRSLPVGAGEYAVLGLFLDDDMRPAHVDYGFLDDYDGTWKRSAAIDFESCGGTIDRVTYDALPPVGTYSLDGTAEPDSEANNLTTSWCFDPTPAGTPGEANFVCPP